VCSIWLLTLSTAAAAAAAAHILEEFLLSFKVLILNHAILVSVLGVSGRSCLLHCFCVDRKQWSFDSLL